MTLRILMASDFYPPFIGGAERQVQLLARELAKRGHHVHAVSVWHHGLPVKEDDFGVTVHRMRALSTLVPWFSRDSRRRFHPPFPDPVITWGVRGLIERSRAALVHASGWISYSCAAALLGKDVPLLVSVRDYGYSCPIRTLMHRGRVCDGPSLAKCLECAEGVYGIPKALASTIGVFGSGLLLRRRLDGIHSISTYVQQITRRDFLVARRTSCDGRSEAKAMAEVVIPSFRETISEENSLEADRNGRFLSHVPSEPYILFVGALQPHKGLNTLLAAYAQIASPPPLVLVGSVWPDTPKVFPRGVTVLKDIPHVDVMEAWKRCLFGVAPSLWPEPFGGVIHEAMSRGKAIIGTAPGGHVDMITDRETGLLVPPDDVVALVRAMELLISDAELRERIGGASRERAKLFTADVVVPQFEALYEQLTTVRR